MLQQVIAAVFLIERSCGGGKRVSCGAVCGVVWPGSLHFTSLHFTSLHFTSLHFTSILTHLVVKTINNALTNEGEHLEGALRVVLVKVEGVESLQC